MSGISSSTSGTSTELIDGVRVDILRIGSGKPLLFLHSVDGIDPQALWLVRLAESFEVIAPWHPGFGHSEWPKEFRSVGDLAFFYLELLQSLDIADAVLMGASFGGWLAAEIAIRSIDPFSHAVLLDPLGIKVGGREDRDIADVHAASQDELARLAYHDPSRRVRDYSAMSHDELLAIARSREAYTYFGWQPYMHNPGLRRWLRRIRIPTLVVWGASDGIVTPGYGRAFAAEIPDARFALIEEAGHYPHVEQPEAVAGLIQDFVNQTAGGQLAAALDHPQE
jgi:pimeloyl-ACP methyl ester carboxylesterase